MTTILDWALLPFYILVILFITWFYGRKKQSSNSIYKYYFFNFLFHILGGLSFALIYEYYYGGGDTFYYFQGSHELVNALFSDFDSFIEIMTTSDIVNSPVEVEYLKSKIQYARAGQEWFMVKLGVIPNLIGANLFLTTTIIYSCISALGNWLLLRGFHLYYQKLNKYLIFSILFIPTVLFWGNGIMKDTITFFCVGALFYLFIQNFYLKSILQSKWHQLLLLSLLIFIVAILKLYIIITFMISIIISLYFRYLKQIKDLIYRIIFSLFSILTLVSFIYILSGTLIKEIEKAETEFIEKAKGFHSWHTERGGSTYSHGEIEYSLEGFLEKSPNSFNVTFYRPYFWEVQSPFMLVSAIESFFLLLLSLYLVLYLKRTLKIIVNDPVLIFCLIYSVTFGVIVGFLAYNFGALDRYKIASFPFYYFAVIKIIEKLKST